MTMPDQQTEAQGRTRATATVTVQRAETAACDESANPSLREIKLTERFSGDLDGESKVRALEVRGRDGSAILVSVQRFCGTLCGREGAFLLEGRETVRDGRISATWTVVPGSGAGDLSGLRGEGGFEGAFGKGSEATLDYWFE